MTSHLPESITCSSPDILVSVWKVNFRKYLNLSCLPQVYIGQCWVEWHAKWSTAWGSRLNAKVSVPSEIDLTTMSITFGTKLPVGYFLIDPLAICDCFSIYSYFRRDLWYSLAIINHSNFYPMWNLLLQCLGQPWVFLLLLGSKCCCWAIT